VTAAVLPGRFVVLWEGRTAGPVPFTLAAEAVESGAEFALVGATARQLDVPCAHVPPAGTGFLARVEPSAVKAGRSAWLELAVPGVRPQYVLSNHSFSWPEGTSTVTISKDGAAVFGPASRPTVGGRDAFPLAFPAGSYEVAVTLQGPTGTRRYTLPLQVG
jgi:hypothetical protein